MIRRALTALTRPRCPICNEPRKRHLLPAHLWIDHGDLSD